MTPLKIGAGGGGAGDGVRLGVPRRFRGGLLFDESEV